MGNPECRVAKKAVAANRNLDTMLLPTQPRSQNTSFSKPSLAEFTHRRINRLPNGSAGRFLERSRSANAAFAELEQSVQESAVATSGLLTLPKQSAGSMEKFRKPALKTRT